MSTTSVVRKKGQVTLPMEIRLQFNINEDDPISILPIGKKGILLVPQKLKSTDLLSKTAQIATRKKISLEEMLAELDEIRHGA